MFNVCYIFIILDLIVPVSRKEGATLSSEDEDEMLTRGLSREITRISNMGWGGDGTAKSLFLIKQGGEFSNL